MPSLPTASQPQVDKVLARSTPISHVKFATQYPNPSRQICHHAPPHSKHYSTLPLFIRLTAPPPTVVSKLSEPSLPPASTPHAPEFLARVHPSLSGRICQNAPPHSQHQQRLPLCTRLTAPPPTAVSMLSSSFNAALTKALLPRGAAST
jgi:hypothetical protein